MIVIEEDIQLRTTLTSDLRAAGYTVTPLYDLNDAAKQYTENANDVDLVICDYTFEAKQDKALPEQIAAIFPTAAVILLSGFSREFVAGTIGKGSWGFLQKPFTSEQLLTQTTRRLNNVTKVRPARGTAPIHETS